MSFDHKAFVFDWRSFSSEMLSWLPEALERSDCDRIFSFICDNQDACSDPYEGDPLGPDWEEAIDSSDIQQLADFALTKYYDPSDCHGLSGAWMKLDQILSPGLRECLLGTAIEGFDPGLQGSYFVTPDDARIFASKLQAADDQVAQQYGRFLAQAANEARGVYVTF